MEKRADIYAVTISSILSAIVIACASLLVGSDLYTPAYAEEFPREIAGLKLFGVLERERAKEQVYNLHGKDLRLDQAFVLRYGDPAVSSHAAIVWISRSKEEEQAQALMERMVNKIRGGAGPYGHLKELTVKNTRVVSLFGKKRRHYIYRLGIDVVWIEVAYPVAEEFLKQALDKLE